MTKSEAVAEALETTLTNHLDEFMTVPAGLHYHRQSGVLTMTGSMAPAIWIDDKGNTQEGASGSGGGDTVLPGFAEEQYRFDIEIWDKYRVAEDARSGLNTWRDAVQACLNGYWHFDDATRQFECFAEAGDPAMEGPGVGSDILWACTVRATVRVMVQAGSAEL